MGMDMASKDRRMGFQPYGELLRQTLYAVQTAPTINVYHGDIVRHGGTALATSFGTLPIIEDGSVPDGAGNGPYLLGSVTAIFDENMDPVQYIAAAEAGDSTVAGYVMVADHPDQRFLAQEDGEGNAIDLNEVGLNADIISVALCAGDSNTGISRQEIDSSSAATTAALDLRLHYPHPDDTVADDTDHYARWIVSINAHYYGRNALGA